jgi:hypothetical protein
MYSGTLQPSPSRSEPQYSLIGVSDRRFPSLVDIPRGMFERRSSGRYWLDLSQISINRQIQGDDAIDGQISRIRRRTGLSPNGQGTPITFQAKMLMSGHEILMEDTRRFRRNHFPNKDLVDVFQSYLCSKCHIRRNGSVLRLRIEFPITVHVR